MSTHHLNMSGSRPLSLVLNDPARTAASASAKAGDDVVATLSGAREIRFEIPTNARIQLREYISHRPKRTDAGDLERDAGGELVYEDVPETRLVVVLASGVTLAMRSSNDERLAGSDPPPHENHPHTNIDVRRWTEPHFFESGSLLEEVEIGTLVDEWSSPDDRAAAN